MKVTPRRQDRSPQHSVSTVQLPARSLHISDEELHSEEYQLQSVPEQVPSSAPLEVPVWQLPVLAHHPHT